MGLRRMIVIVAGILLWSGAALASELGTCTAITSLPTTITASGVYCLTGNLTFTILSGGAITVNADSVVIDLNGYRLKHDPTVPNPVITAILISAGSDNVTIRNGLISSVEGAAVGSYGKATIVEDVEFFNNDTGIVIHDRHAIIRRNFCRANGVCVKILDGGSSSRVIDNDIIGDDTNNDEGIIVDASNVFVVENRLSRLEYGVFYQYGTGKYRANLTLNVAIPFTNGTDAGENN